MIGFNILYNIHKPFFKDLSILSGFLSVVEILFESFCGMTGNGTFKFTLMFKLFKARIDNVDLILSLFDYPILINNLQGLYEKKTIYFLKMLHLNNIK